MDILDIRIFLFTSPQLRHTQVECPASSTPIIDGGVTGWRGGGATVFCHNGIHELLPYHVQHTYRLELSVATLQNTANSRVDQEVVQQWVIPSRDQRTKGAGSAVWLAYEGRAAHEQYDHCHCVHTTYICSTQVLWFVHGGRGFVPSLVGWQH